MSLVLANNAIAMLSAPIGTVATSLSVQSGQGSRFPVNAGTDWFPLTVVKSDGSLEIMRCTQRATDTFTVTRAQEGTTALAFSAGDRVELRWTRAAAEEFLRKDGTQAMTGDLAMGTHKVTGLGAGTASTDAVTKAQLDAVDLKTQKLTSVRRLRGGLNTSTSVAVMHDGCVLRDASNNTVYVGGSTGRVISFGTNAINGRDQAGNFSTQWVYIYALWKAGLTECDYVASATYGTPPNLLGYTHWCFLYPVRIGATANTAVTHTVEGGVVKYPSAAGASLGGPISMPTASTAYSFSNLGDYVPPIAFTFDVQITFTGQRTGSGGFLVSGNLRNDGGGTWGSYYNQSNGTAGVSQGCTAYFNRVPNYGGNYAFLADSQGVWQAMNAYFNLQGFEFDN